MNIHPLFVHFPIALLSIYSIIELLRVKQLTRLPYLFYIKGFLVILGTLASFVTMQTGEWAAGNSFSEIVEKHEFFAGVSTYTFAIIAIAYALVWLKESPLKSKITHSMFRKIYEIAETNAESILRSPLVLVLALIGLVAITVTGALGGAMVYGPTVDPIVTFIYNLVM